MSGGGGSDIYDCMVSGALISVCKCMYTWEHWGYTMVGGSFVLHCTSIAS